MRILGHVAATQIESVTCCSCATGYMDLSLHSSCQLSMKLVNRWNSDYYSTPFGYLFTGLGENTIFSKHIY